MKALLAAMTALLLISCAQAPAGYRLDPGHKAPARKGLSSHTLTDR